MKVRGWSSPFLVNRGCFVTRKMIVPLMFGILGAGILIWLGAWQLQRMSWKNDMLARIQTQLNAAPMPIETVLGPDPTQFAAVYAKGAFIGPEIHVLSSIKQVGVIYRIVQAFQIQSGERILVDRGFVMDDQKNAPKPTRATEIVGNFRTTNEVDGFTPAPDLKTNTWFARDVPAMAKKLNTLPVLVILRQTAEENPVVRPLPVSTEGIPNNHMNYAITWFSLAVVWLGMTVFMLWRIWRAEDKE